MIDENWKRYIVFCITYIYTLTSVTLNDIYIGVLCNISKLFHLCYSNQSNGLDLRFNSEGDSCNVLCALSTKINSQNTTTAENEDITGLMKFFLTFYDHDLQSLKFFLQIHKISLTDNLTIIYRRGFMIYESIINVAECRSSITETTLMNTESVVSKKISRRMKF